MGSRDGDPGGRDKTPERSGVLQKQDIQEVCDMTEELLYLWFGMISRMTHTVKMNVAMKYGGIRGLWEHLRNSSG